MFVDHKEVAKLKEQYPKGTVVKCVYMEDPFSPIEDGMIGVVDHVDDIGQIHVRWKNGSSLALIVGQDEFIKLSVPNRSKGDAR